jgi:hypothetical protein
VGTFFRSWDLVGQSFTVLKSDKELLWLPVVSALFCLTAMAIIFCAGVLVLMPTASMPHDPVQQKLLGQQALPFIFLFYLVTYSIAIFFNVALVSIVSNRLDGGKATLNDGLQVAWNRKWRILQWALLVSTVGMLLSMLERQLRSVGRIVTRMVGFVWTLASFFVVPVLAAEDVGPVEALYESADIFRETWGEEVVGGFSFGTIFLVLSLPDLLLPVLGARLGETKMLAGIAIMVIYWLLLGVISSAVHGIFVAVLYRYATTKQVSFGFHSSDLSEAWQPKQ